MNRNAKPVVITAEELRFALEIHDSDGYNFAGWYTDRSYDHRIAEITEENAANMVLFAKWTRPIDNRYNVEMYSYQTASVLSRNQKELKECTPFTLSGAKRMMRLGILTMCIPVVVEILIEIAYIIMKNVLTGVGEVNVDMNISFGIGIMFIVTSLICRYGAVQLGNKDTTN